MRVVVFGAGLGGMRLWIALAPLSGVEVVGFIDNDRAKHGTTVAGLPVCGASGLAALDYERILIASVHHAEIRAQLVARGVPASRLTVLTAGGDFRMALHAAGVPLGAPETLPPAPAGRVAIFGAGMGGLKVWEELAARTDIEVTAFIESDARRRRSPFLGLPVIAPEALDLAAVDAVVVGSMQGASILAALHRAGVPRSRIYTTLTLLESA